MSTSNGRQWLAERPYVIAIAITLALVLWMVSGAMQAEEAPVKRDKASAPIAKVQVTHMVAQQVHDVVELFGRTEPDRIATLKAEVKGKIVAVLAERGARVSKGQVIAKIAPNDLNAQIASAEALLKQREIEYKGAKSLSSKGYQGQAKLAQAEAELQAAQASLTKLNIDLANTVIKAPFDGVLNSRYVEQGDYVAFGDDIAMVADLDPIVVRAYATEKQVSQLHVGQQASTRLLNEHRGTGQLRYIASVADEATNTFKVEITLANPDYQQLAGISTEVSIPLEQVAAIKISPALLALDEQGNIGVKSVQDNKVVFTGIDIVKSESDGVWLSGLGEQADIITLGQGFVRAGDPVQPVPAAE